MNVKSIIIKGAKDLHFEYADVLIKSESIDFLQISYSLENNCIEKTIPIQDIITEEDDVNCTTTHDELMSTEILPKITEDCSLSSSTLSESSSTDDDISAHPWCR